MASSKSLSTRIKIINNKPTHLVGLFMVDLSVLISNFFDAFISTFEL